VELKHCYPFRNGLGGINLDFIVALAVERCPQKGQEDELDEFLDG